MTGEITAAGQDPLKDSFLASVHVENFTRTSVPSSMQSLVEGTDPEKIASTMAQDILHLTKPYVLASYFKVTHDNKAALKLIGEGDVSKELGLSLQAEIYLTQHNFAEAIWACQYLIKMKPEFFDAHRLLAIILLEEQPPEVYGAIKEFNKAIANKAIAIDQTVDAHNGLGDALLVHKRPPELENAIREFRTAIEIDQNNSNPKNSAFAHNGLGYALLAKHPPKVDCAIDEFRTAIAIDPNFAVAHSNLDSARQTRQCLTVIANDPKSANARGKECLGGARLAMRPPDVDDAITEYSAAAIESDPESASAYNGWGYALLLKQPPNVVGAIEEFKNALRIDRNFAVALSNLDSARQTQQCLTVIASDPKSISPRECDCLGDALLSMRPPDVDGAINEYGTAIAIEPDDVRAYDGLSDALLAQQLPNLDGSIKEYRMAIAMIFAEVPSCLPLGGFPL